MTAENVPAKYRVEDFFTHIDMGFINRRLAISALGSLRDEFLSRQKPAGDHMTTLVNDHLVVTMLIDTFSRNEATSLAEALTLNKPRVVFMSTERLEPCPQIRTSDRVTQRVHLEFDYGKPVVVAYHTSHIASDTGRMVLIEGYLKGYREAVLGLLYDKGDRFEIEPMVMGAPFLDHPRNKAKDGTRDLWHGYDYGEILAEDIEQFGKIRTVTTANSDEWMMVMKRTPEAHVKAAFAKLLSEPTKKYWGGEENDHFSSNVTVAKRRRTAAFFLKAVFAP